jgi:hypothetical protein
MAVAPTYRHEYLTGIAMAEGLAEMNVAVMAHNHSSVEEHVRAFGWVGRNLLFDTGDDASAVEPHNDWVEVEQMIFASEVPVGYRVQILTTSTNLVLSVGDPNGIGVLTEPPREPIIPFPYYGPTDFAVFVHPVHVPIPVPPVGAISG